MYSGSPLDVDTHDNPAESQGCSVKEASIWWEGPSFLSVAQVPPRSTGFPQITDGYPEVKRIMCHASSGSPSFPSLLKQIEYFSDWYRAKRAVSLCLRYIDILRAKTGKTSTTEPRNGTSKPKRSPALTVADLEKAERVIAAVQAEAFPEELKILTSLTSYTKTRVECRNKTRMQKKSSCLYLLDPYVGDDGLIRVGGRIRRADDTSCCTSESRIHHQSDHCITTNVPSTRVGKSHPRWNNSIWLLDYNHQRISNLISLELCSVSQISWAIFISKHGRPTQWSPGATCALHL